MQFDGVLASVAEKKPIVHFLTNYVSANDCANVVLALGGSPIMADAIEEVEEILSLASSLVINIGTINAQTFSSMLLAGKIANQKGIPIVLDPVGAGASKFRNESVMEILESIRIDVIKANASEMSFIAQGKINTGGVDANPKDQNLDQTQIQEVARRYGCVCAVTGEIDWIIDQKESIALKHGVARLSSITGSGCMIGAMIGTFLGASEDAFCSSVAGVGLMGIAGEIADPIKGNGSFHTKILDVISASSEYIKRISVGL